MIEASQKVGIFAKWLIWHYFEATRFLLRAFKNYLVFNFNYFSIPLLLKTLFSHWRRYVESYGRGFDPKRYFWAFSSNMISRVLGAIIRIGTIIIGLIFEFFIFLGGVLAVIFWLALPFLAIFLILAGVQFILTYGAF
jgi:hypothetical protein